MKAVYILLLLLITTLCGFSQVATEHLKNSWFFGVETGSNTISSDNLEESKKSFQRGLIANYYFSNN